MSRRHRPTAQRGFTLIELMVALLISSLLVIMLLAIFSRVSFAYREQQQIVSLQRLLVATQEALIHDAKHAGLAMEQGFRIANDGTVVLRSPVVVINSSTGPDAVGFYYADFDRQAMVTKNVAAGELSGVLIDDNPGFVPGELVVLSTATPMTIANPISDADAKLTTYEACVLQVESVTTNSITFFESGDWGQSGNAHCAGGATENKSMVYPFVSRFWRIDPTRPGLGALQLETTGASLGKGAPMFTDMAYGVVDLQVATYFYDNDTDSSDTLDPDNDGARDWYSSDEQATKTAPLTSGTGYVDIPLAMSMSIVVRTDANVEGIYTTNSPQLTDPSNIAHNTVGDRDSFSLPSTTIPGYDGYRVYRHLTFQVDFRNMGLGR